MKDARLRIQSLIAAFILLALTALSAKAQETGAEFLSDLHDFRVNNYLALDAFYNFSATGDTETLNRIVVGINNSNDAMNSVVASTSGVLSEQQVEELNQAFDQFKNLMRGNINEVRDRGYPDLRLMADLANQALNMNNLATELYSVAQEGSGIKADTRIESARGSDYAWAAAEVPEMAGHASWVDAYYPAGTRVGGHPPTHPPLYEWLLAHRRSGP